MKPEIYVDTCSLCSWWIGEILSLWSLRGWGWVKGACWWVACAAAWDNVEDQWSLHPVRAISGSMVLTSPWAVLMCVARVTTETHTHVCGLGYRLKPHWCVKWNFLDVSWGIQFDSWWILTQIWMPRGFHRVEIISMSCFIGGSSKHTSLCSML